MSVQLVQAREIHPLERLFSLQFQCCGVRDRSDFNVTQIWDRRNPWWNSSMSMDENFTYPLTCCPIGNVFSKNWDDLPLDKLQSAATCATTGNFTYSIVRSFLSISNGTNVSVCFRGATIRFWTLFVQLRCGLLLLLLLLF